MKKAGVILAAFLILTPTLSVKAQEQGQAPTAETEANWRNFEVTAAGGISLPNGAFKDWNDSLGAGTGVNFGGAAGYYFSEAFCLGALFHYSQNPMEIYDLHYRLYDAGLYAKYALVGESDFEPYVKVSGSALFAKFPTWVGPTSTRLREVSYNPGFALGLYAGALYYTSEFGGIFLEASYHMAMLKDKTGDHAGIDYILEDKINYLELRGGITVFFGPEQ